jgi:hypothetical protein
MNKQHQVGNMFVWVQFLLNKQQQQQQRQQQQHKHKHNHSHNHTHHHHHNYHQFLGEKTNTHTKKNKHVACVNNINSI